MGSSADCAGSARGQRKTGGVSEYLSQVIIPQHPTGIRLLKAYTIMTISFTKISLLKRERETEKRNYILVPASTTTPIDLVAVHRLCFPQNTHASPHPVHTNKEREKPSYPTQQRGSAPRNEPKAEIEQFHRWKQFACLLALIISFFLCKHALIR